MLASVATERNGTIAWVWNGAILYAFAGLQTLQTLQFTAKFFGLGKAYGLRNGIVRWVRVMEGRQLLLLAY